MEADVIIVGAGPAGSLAAYNLASNGLQVLILEKAIFPRYKVCGAGLTYKILREIPFDLSPIFETSINSFVFSCHFEERFTRTSSEPMLFCTSREKLDDFLLQKAVDAGAKVLHGEKIVSIEQHEDCVVAETKGRKYHSKLLIGADGAASIVARSAKLRDNIMPGLAWEAEVEVEPEVLRRYSKTVFLDWGTFPGGYGWVFPKEDHLSIGVGGPASLSRYMMPYYRRMLKYLETSHERPDGHNMALTLKDVPVVVTRTISLKSWPIPVRVRRSRFHQGRVLVAGDAAGLTDPLTGEGIYYAVRSGILAADACYNYLSGKGASLESYSHSVNQELMGELLEANRIKDVFNTFPYKIHRFVRDRERAWSAFARILRGERWYADVRKGFGKWKIFWGLTCKVSHWISDSKERKLLKSGFSGGHE